MYNALGMSFPSLHSIISRANSYITSAESIKTITPGQILDIIGITDISQFEKLFKSIRDIALYNIKFTTVSEYISSIPDISISLFTLFTNYFEEINASIFNFFDLFESKERPDTQTLIIHLFDVTNNLINNWATFSASLSQIGFTAKKIQELEVTLLGLYTLLGGSIFSGIPTKELIAIFLSVVYIIPTQKSIQFMETFGNTLQLFANYETNAFNLLYTTLELTFPDLALFYNKVLNLFKNISRPDASVKDIYLAIMSFVYIKSTNSDPLVMWDTIWIRLQQFCGNPPLFNILDDIKVNGFSNRGLYVGPYSQEAVGYGESFKEGFQKPFEDLGICSDIFDPSIWSSSAPDRFFPYFFDIDTETVKSSFSDLIDMLNKIEVFLLGIGSGTSYITTVLELFERAKGMFEDLISSKSAAKVIFGPNTGQKLLDVLNEVQPLISESGSLEAILSNFPPQFCNIPATLPNIYAADFSKLSAYGMLNLIQYGEISGEGIIDIVAIVRRSKMSAEKLEKVANEVVETGDTTVQEVEDALDNNEEILKHISMVIGVAEEMFDPNYSTVNFDEVLEILKFDKTVAQKKVPIIAKALYGDLLSFDDLDTLFEDDSQFVETTSLETSASTSKVGYIHLLTFLSIFIGIVIVSIIICVIVMHKKKKENIQII